MEEQHIVDRAEEALHLKADRKLREGGREGQGGKERERGSFQGLRTGQKMGR